ncbi:hypothetical protein ECENHK_12465 [Enterobacter kobei]|nr:hypothetical protein ECENHK_12465 [Enterobacter kobei]
MLTKTDSCTISVSDISGISRLNKEISAHRQSTGKEQAADAKRKKKKLLSTDINTTTFIQNTYDKWLRTKIYFTLCAIGMNFKHIELLSEGAFTLCR